MSEENPIYVKTSDKENLILSMLAISQKNVWNFANQVRFL